MYKQLVGEVHRCATAIVINALVLNQRLTTAHIVHTRLTLAVYMLIAANMIQ